MATWIQEEASSNYGKKTEEDVWKYRAKYYCATPELFHVIGEWGTPQSPMRMAMAHKHTIKSESYSVGMLAKKVYRMDATSTLFQQDKDSNAIKVRFEQSLAETLMRIDPTKRHTITQVVHTLKSKPNMETPNMCFRDTIV